MHKATLLLIVRDGKVLLAEKKRGKIGVGTLNGPGGVVESGETLEECVVRETLEEFDLDVYHDLLKQVGLLKIFAAGNLDSEVHIFRTSDFSGELCETKDVQLPAWYSLGSIPYKRMLESDRTWMRTAIRGGRFAARVDYREAPRKDYQGIQFFKPQF